VRLFGGAREKAMRSMAMSVGAPLNSYNYCNLPCGMGRSSAAAALNGRRRRDGHGGGRRVWASTIDNSESTMWREDDGGDHLS